MVKIGFIDYFLDEWHANNYPKWFRAASETLGEEFVVSYAWAELDAPPQGGKTTKEWYPTRSSRSPPYLSLFRRL